MSKPSISRNPISLGWADAGVWDPRVLWRGRRICFSSPLYWKPSITVTDGLHILGEA